MHVSILQTSHVPSNNPTLFQITAVHSLHPVLYSLMQITQLGSLRLLIVVFFQKLHLYIGQNAHSFRLLPHNMPGSAPSSRLVLTDKPLIQCICFPHCQKTQMMHVRQKSLHRSFLLLSNKHPDSSSISD